MNSLSRRRVLQAAAAAWAMGGSRCASVAFADDSRGLVVGHPDAAEVGMAVLAAGGNAVDAIVAAAATAGVVAMNSCGIGGYGGHAVIAMPWGRVEAIDFNSAAPAAAREDMFPLDGAGKVVGQVNAYGWQAAGVPGTLAGLQLAAERFGSRKFGDLLQPAIRRARDGFLVSASLAAATKGAAKRLSQDAALARLLLPGGTPAAVGSTLQNPDLAKMLETLATDNSAAAFYRGKYAEQTAKQSQQHGGLLTVDDLANYRARVVKPLSTTWQGATIFTAPLTAGGCSVLQALNALKAMAWETQDPADVRTAQAKLEAMRIAWHDRLRLLGDPADTADPTTKLLSADYAGASAARVKLAVADRQPVAGNSDGRAAGGTIHLSAADRGGMFASLTLTHGEAFGAQIAVDGLGLVLGHGMSRFDPRPGQANSPRPGWRPLNNMCPVIVLRNERPVAALGATGGRRIPNTLYDVLAGLVGRRQPLAAAAAAPRMHTEGDLRLGLSKTWPQDMTSYLQQIGYLPEGNASANLQALERDPVSGKITSASG